MGRQDLIRGDEAAARLHRLGIEAIRIDDKGHGKLLNKASDKSYRFRCFAQAGANGNDITG